jgi:sigma-B regulation protein RsbU (phosphoserine phosphatase)
MPASQNEPARILLIEDSPTQAQLIKSQLEEVEAIKFVVIHEESLSAALDRLRDEEVTLILCDLNLPDSIGLDTFRRVRRVAPHIPIVIHSSESDQEQAVTAVAEGAEDYLVKNHHDTNQLVRCIRFAVERSRRKHAEHEVHAAARVQRMLFPASGPILRGFDIAGDSFPASEVGGDYFDFIPTSNDSIMVVVGDVSGHGMGPAMRMAESRAYLRAITDTWAHLRALAKSHVDPGEILTHLNRLLTTDQHDSFMSMFFCRVDPTTRKLIYASAGHPGYLIRSSGETSILPPTGVPLGAVKDAIIVTVPEVHLSEGDVILLPTDGIFETANRAEAPFGIERTLAIGRENRDRRAIEIVQLLYAAAREFAEGAQQHDDITAVVIKATSSFG